MNLIKTDYKRSNALRFLQINTFYQKYLLDFYKNDATLASRPADEQVQQILDDGFSAIHNFTPYITKLGYESKFIIANSKPAQFKWLQENHLNLTSSNNWMLDITRRQIEAYRPEILFLSDAFVFDSKFIRQLSVRPDLVIGWTGEPVPQGLDWSDFDIILSNFSYSRQRAKDYGAKATENFYPGFVEWVNRDCDTRPPVYDVVFVGQWSGLHQKRNQIIHALAKAASGKQGFRLGLYLLGDKQKMPPEVQSFCCGERFGLAMHQALRSGKIAINAGILPEAGNMRLFETTGTGVFLLTEYQHNITDYFLPGEEIETFKDNPELIEKIYYYLKHSEKRQAIARRGQERCLRDHAMDKRIAELDKIIRKHLSIKPSARQTCGSYAGAPTQHSDLDPNAEVIRSQADLSNVQAIARQKRFGDYVVAYNGLSVHCHDLLSFYMAAKDIFLQRIYDFTATAPSPTVIDGGGHIGLFTLFAKQKYPDAHITVFEPDHLSLQLLKKNIAVNKLRNVSLVEAGLYKQDGELSFCCDASDGSSIYAGKNNESIRTVKLSEYITQDVDFLKLNIEGAEWDVISEVSEKLHLIKEMVVEYHGFPETGQNLHRILNLLDRAGFRYMIHDFDGLTNPVTKPPFRLDTHSRFFLLIYAKKLFLPSQMVDTSPTIETREEALEPVSRKFGFDRGTPIDRYYIERFLAQHKLDIQGHVLEIGDNHYTRKFGTRVTDSQILNVVAAPGVTLVGDLATGENIAENAFDCIILTQSIQMIYDVKRALKNAIKALKIGGTLLITASGISQISRYDMDRWGEYWRFTDKSLKSLLVEFLPEENIQVESFGNVASAKAFLDGLAVHELSENALNHTDKDYQVVLAARVFKSPAKPAERSSISPISKQPASFETPLILLYHRVAHDPIDAQLLAVSPENFGAHLKILAQNYRVIPLSMLMEELRQDVFTPDTIALTFDDGYLDNLTNALPLLEKYGIAATIFVASGMVDSQHEFWWDAMERIFFDTHLLPEALDLQGPQGRHTWDLTTPLDRLKAHDELGGILRAKSVGDITGFMNDLHAWAAQSLNGRSSHLVVNHDQLVRLAASALIEIGSHTVSHPRLSALPPEEQYQEITHSKRQLEKRLQQKIRFFSYPYGSVDSFTPETIRLVKEAGYAAGIANIQGNVANPVDLYRLPRRLVRNWSGQIFYEWLKNANKDELEAQTVSTRPRSLIEYQMYTQQ